MHAADPSTILRRIDAVLTVMEAEALAPRAVYLVRSDLEAFLAAQQTIERPVRHRGYAVRLVSGPGRSCIYSRRGIARAIPRQV